MFSAEHTWGRSCHQPLQCNCERPLKGRQCGSWWRMSEDTLQVGRFLTLCCLPHTALTPTHTYNYWEHYITASGCLMHVWSIYHINILPNQNTSCIAMKVWSKALFLKLFVQITQKIMRSSSLGQKSLKLLVFNSVGETLCCQIQAASCWGGCSVTPEA